MTDKNPTGKIKGLREKVVSKVTHQGKSQAMQKLVQMNENRLKKGISKFVKKLYVIEDNWQHLKEKINLKKQEVRTFLKERHYLYKMLENKDNYKEARRNKEFSFKSVFLNTNRFQKP